MARMNHDSTDPTEDALRGLISAFHVLHQHRVLDERGQISVRNPTDPETFFISNMPAVLISTRDDIEIRNVSDGSMADSNIEDTSPHSDSEHFLHSCIYDRFSGVNSVVHSHNQGAIVFGLCNSSGSMLRPTNQMVGFIGPFVPIFDAGKHYPSMASTHSQDLVVNRQYLGNALAKLFDQSSATNGSRAMPSCKMVLQRGHGFTTCAQSLEDAVFQAVQLCRNTAIQTRAMVQRIETDLEVVYLTEKEGEDSLKTISSTVQYAWSAWLAEVQNTGLYRNDLQRPTSRASTMRRIAGSYQNGDGVVLA